MQYVAFNPSQRARDRKNKSATALVFGFPVIQQPNLRKILISLSKGYRLFIKSLKSFSFRMLFVLREICSISTFAVLIRQALCSGIDIHYIKEGRLHQIRYPSPLRTGTRMLPGQANNPSSE
jgi:hypothetical protein